MVFCYMTPKILVALVDRRKVYIKASFFPLQAYFNVLIAQQKATHAITPSALCCRSWVCPHLKLLHKSQIDITSNMSFLEKPHQVGLLNPKPNFGISQDPLNRKKLASMDKEDREQEIIKRANFFTQRRPWGGATGSTLTRAIREAMSEGRSSFIKPLHPIKMPME